MTTTPRQPGWQQHPADPNVVRYWDGARWTHEQRWDGAGWVAVAVGSPSVATPRPGPIPTPAPTPIPAPAPAATAPVDGPRPSSDLAAQLVDGARTILSGPQRNLVIAAVVISSIVMIVAGALVLRGGGDDDGWSDSMRREMQTACQDDGVSEDDCRCYVDGLEDELSSDEIRQIVAGNEPAGLESRVLRAMRDCGVDPMGD